MNHDQKCNDAEISCMKCNGFGHRVKWIGWTFENTPATEKVRCVDCGGLGIDPVRAANRALRAAAAIGKGGKL